MILSKYARQQLRIAVEVTPPEKLIGLETHMPAALDTIDSLEATLQDIYLEMQHAQPDLVRVRSLTEHALKRLDSE